MPLHSCTCDFSAQMRANIRRLTAQGKSNDEIIAAFVNEYGETVRSAPPPKGFYLTAWVTPFILILVIGGILAWLFRARRHQPSGAADKASERKPPARADIEKLLERFDK